jgi:hypothetical protein
MWTKLLSPRPPRFAPPRNFKKTKKWWKNKKCLGTKTKIKIAIFSYLFLQTNKLHQTHFFHLLLIAARPSYYHFSCHFSIFFLWPRISTLVNRKINIWNLLTPFNFLMKVWARFISIIYLEKPQYFVFKYDVLPIHLFAYLPCYCSSKFGF